MPISLNTFRSLLLLPLLLNLNWELEEGKELSIDTLSIHFRPQSIVFKIHRIVPKQSEWNYDYLIESFTSSENQNGKSFTFPFSVIILNYHTQRMQGGGEYLLIRVIIIGISSEFLCAIWTNSVDSGVNYTMSLIVSLSLSEKEEHSLWKEMEKNGG